MLTEPARKELSRFKKSSVDLAEELSAIIKVAKYMREKIESDMVEDKGLERGKIVKAISDLAMAFSKAVDAKVKLEKHLTAEAESLSEADQIDAVIGFFKELKSEKRREMLQECLDFHRQRSPNDNKVV